MAEEKDQHLSEHTGSQDDHSADSHGVKAEAEHFEGVGYSDDHGAHSDHGDGHGDGHGPDLGRYVQHPPEPPHLIMIWHKKEQKKLIAKYAKEHPNEPKPHSYEAWLQKNEEGEWVPVEGEKPTTATVLHYGTLKKDLPLIGYAPWENHVYLAGAMIFLVALFYIATASFRKDKRAAIRKPSRWQVFIEFVVGGFDEFTKGILGEENGRKYMPFIGSLFCLILVANLMGLVPLLKAPTSYILVTFSLALCTFIVTQSTAWLKLGPLTYLHHLAGSPKDALGWFLSPLFLVLEGISDFIAKPLSLALRLFGNILGKDILLGSFLGMGIALVGAISPVLGNWFGLPLTIPFLLLGLLLSTIQALVFALLSAIYISLVLPHDHDHDEDHHDDHGDGHLKHANDAVHEALPT